MKRRFALLAQLTFAGACLALALVAMFGPQTVNAQRGAGDAIAAAMAGGEVVDLTVLISEQLPAHWPTHAPFQRWTFNWFKPVAGAYDDNLGQSGFPYYGQRYVSDEHTGTETECSAHFIRPEGSGAEFAGPTGAMTCDKVPPSQWMGPAAVIDVRSVLDQAENGKSPVITPDMVQDWEAANGDLQAGEVVLFYSGYSDKYYKPFPEGNRLAFDPLIKGSAPGWPAPSPETMEYLHSKGVRHIGIDSPSMGYVEGGQPTHVAGLQHGMTWDELLTGLGRLPARGAFYISLHPKIVDASGGMARAIGIKDKG